MVAGYYQSQPEKLTWRELTHVWRWSKWRSVSAWWKWQKIGRCQRLRSPVNLTGMRFVKVKLNKIFQGKLGGLAIFLCGWLIRHILKKIADQQCFILVFVAVIEDWIYSFYFFHYVYHPAFPPEFPVIYHGAFGLARDQRRFGNGDAGEWGNSRWIPDKLFCMKFSLKLQGGEQQKITHQVK